MRTLVLLTILLMASLQQGKGQGMPVYDNTNFITLGKSLIESAKQTSQLLKTVNFLKEQKERIEKVNAVLRELKAVQEIIDNNQELYTTIQDDLREILNSPYIHAGEVTRISASFNSLVEQAMEDLDLLQGLLTSNYLNMTDAQRLAVLEAQRKRSREMRAEIALKKKRYQHLIEFRKLREAIDSRALQY